MVQNIYLWEDSQVVQDLQGGLLCVDRKGGMASPLLDRVFKAIGDIILRYYHLRQRPANYHLPFLCDFKQAKTVLLHIF